MFEPGNLDQLDEDLLIDPVGSEGGEDNNRSSGQFADLNLTKTVDNPRPQEGEPVTFTIMIHNSGPANATNIAVSELLPPGLRLEAVTPGRGIFNQAAGLWTVSALAPGQNATLTVQASVTSGEALLNTAQISTVDQFDPDSTPGNDVAGEDDQDSAGVDERPVWLPQPRLMTANQSRMKARPHPTYLAIRRPGQDRSLVPSVHLAGYIS